MPTRHEVCAAEELPPGERRIVDVDGAPHAIGVFNVSGELYALANVCPHQLAPLCEGPITGTVESDSVGDFQLKRAGEIVQCPWHGWKFDIASGASVFNPHELRTRTYDVEVEPVEGNSPDSNAEEEASDQSNEFGTALEGEDPPIDTYPVEVDDGVVVLYV